MKSLKTILAVDDDQDILDILKLSLEEVGGFSVFLASSGREAIEIISEINPDLVLLDMMMPEMNGRETIKHLRAVSGFSKQPVIFLTAKVMKNEQEDFMQSGAIGVIAKPFDPMTLPQVINEKWNNVNE